MRRLTVHLAYVLSALLPAGLLSAQTTDSDQEVVRAALARVDVERVRADLTTLVGFGTRHALHTGETPGRGAAAAASWIHSRLQEAAQASNGRMTVAFDAFDPRTVARSGDLPALNQLGVKEIKNVIATLQGSDPHRVLIVSGHYDSRVSQRYDVASDAPGANDDGSGTCVILELARVLASVETRASIWFVAFTAEELGLWGSTHLARRCDAERVVVEAMITNDIVGGAKDAEGNCEDRVVRIFSEGRPQAGPDSHARVVALARNPSEADSPSRELARHTARAVERHLPGFEPRLIFRQDRFLRGGDHRPFNLQGFAAIRLTEPKENFLWQHQDLREENGILYGDRLENVDVDYVARVARVNAAALLELALAPAPPERVVIRNRLSNSTTLSWTKTKDDTVAGYRLLLRRTHEPRWTVQRDIGLVNEIEVEESKDDWLFALQAHDAHGHASLPTFALPGR